MNALARYSNVHSTNVWYEGYSKLQPAYQITRAGVTPFLLARSGQLRNSTQHRMSNTHHNNALTVALNSTGLTLITPSGKNCQRTAPCMCAPSCLHAFAFTRSKYEAI